MFSENQWLFIFAAVCAVEAAVSLWRMVQGVEKRSAQVNLAQTSKSPYPRRWIIGIAAGIALSLALSVFGFYRTQALEPPTKQKVSTKNIEIHVRRWLEGLMVSTSKAPDGVNFMLQGMAQSGTPFIIAQQKDHDEYLVLQVLGIFSPEHRDIFDKLSATEQTEFIQQLAQQAAKEKINLAQLGAQSIIERRLAINDSLTEASFMAALDQLSAEAMTTKGIVVETFNRWTKAKQPLPTPNKGASPH